MCPKASKTAFHRTWIYDAHDAALGGQHAGDPRVREAVIVNPVLRGNKDSVRDLRRASQQLQVACELGPIKRRKDCIYLWTHERGRLDAVDEEAERAAQVRADCF